MPIKVFFDFWAIANLLERASHAGQKQQLISFCQEGYCQVILTIQFIHELHRDSNTQRAAALCKGLESFAKQVQAKWLRLRTEIQGEECTKVFFEAQGISVPSQPMFVADPLDVFPAHRRTEQLEEIRKQGFMWFFHNKSLFSDALQLQTQYPQTKTELKRAVSMIIGAEKEIRESRWRYIYNLIPTTCPNSQIVIPEEARKSFAQEMDLKRCPAIYAESLLSQITTADMQAKPTEQDLLDLQHLVCALPYVDIVLLDKKFCGYADIVKKRWKGEKSLAETFNSLGEALSRIQELSAHN